MEKKYFQISFSIAALFFIALVVCSTLLRFNVNVGSIDLKSLGKGFLCAWLLFCVLAVVFGVMALLNTPKIHRPQINR
jgi:hypothetical protein